MVQHVLKHGGVAFVGHQLVGVCEITIVIVGSCRNARSHARTEFGQIKAPLFFGVTPEELVTQILTHTAEHHVFTGLVGFARFTHFGQILGCTGFIQFQPIELVQGLAVDGNGQILRAHFGQNAVFVKAPMGELR